MASVKGALQHLGVLLLFVTLVYGAVMAPLFIAYLLMAGIKELL